MDITVNYNNTQNQEEAFNVAKQQITPEYIAKWNVKAEVTFDESGRRIEANGKGFTLALVFNEDACEVECKLSLLLKPLKGKILETVKEKLQRHI